MSISMSAMVAAEQLVNEGAVHTLSRLLLASTDGAVDDEGCALSTVLAPWRGWRRGVRLFDEDAVHLETEERGF